MADLPFDGAAHIKDIAGKWGLDAGTTEAAGEESADGEGGIADNLCIQSGAILAGEESIERIKCGGVGVCFVAALPIGVGGDDEADEGFAAPAIAHEFRGEEIEEFRVGGGFPTGAKVIKGAHEA